MSNQDATLELRKLQTRLAKCQNAFVAATDEYAKLHLTEVAAELLREIRTLQADREQKIYVI